MDLLKIYNYSTAKKTNSVVVLFAGPSTMQNKERIIDYVKNNNSVVIGSNYSYESIGIKSDYTYVANDFKLDENEKHINNDIIVPGRIFSGEIDPKKSRKTLRRHIDRGFNVFMAGGKEFSTTYKIKSGAIEIKPDGFLPYGRFSSAGHGAMLMSIVCRPKKMLIVGLDGPSDSSCKEKIMFTGKKVPYNKPQKNENFKNHFTNVILPSMRKFGISIETYSNVIIYGLDKSDLGIKIIE